MATKPDDDGLVISTTQREALQKALIDILILPTLPLVADALQDMLGQRGKLRDMKAAYIIAEVARDLVLKGVSDGQTLRSVVALVENVKERLDALDAPPEEIGSPPDQESVMARAARASREGQENGHTSGHQGRGRIAELTPRATDDLGT